ncbi:MAG: hypothetical protein JXA82_02270 [Sedimentisphaerales bacterium]|nr:hypothetical protein [Sedimentisphaerales bacterium]
MRKPWTDNELFFNDVDTASWKPIAWKLNPFSGERMKIPGGIYRVSPDGQKALVCNLATMQRTQKGYGVIVPDEHVPLHKGLSADDGLWLIDTATGQRKLLISIEQAVKQTTEPSDWDSYSQMEVYGFHCKWSPRGDRLLFSIRYYPAEFAGSMDVLHRGGCHFDVFTARPDGTELCNAVPDEQWQKDGHHINFFPDGEKLSMNLAIDSDGLKFVQVNIDGSELKPMIDTIPGSGHPTVHPDGRHILTDEYSFAALAWPDGTIPLRWIDIQNKTEITLVRIPAKTLWQEGKSQLRLDPHPAWSNDYKWVAYNAFIDGTRKVLISRFPEEGI